MGPIKTKKKQIIKKLISLIEIKIPIFVVIYSAIYSNDNFLSNYVMVVLHKNVGLTL